MKTSQDFNENFNQYSSEIEKEMSNLNRMLQEFASSGWRFRVFRIRTATLFCARILRDSTPKNRVR